ncbi:MAG: adenylate/guanylate cyclase domain-containing protein [Kofleriaceae bacterium]|nr:adenylate/guanylate cyclase domain-containing protein [Kofleriaceae bacterium]MCB9572057.1 adenylate/guanylate cyclase domain-containing protein [Kofleriaceae bacterium]
MFDPGDPRLKGSEARLWRLIEERTRPGADKAAIDRRIWDLFGETWAVMFTDLSGFSRRVEEYGVIHFLQTIHEHKELLLPIVADHDGILIKAEADSFLILYRRPDAALDCARAMMAACERINVGRAEEELILLCVGIGYGRLLRIGDHDVYGAEVNAASKLGEDVARAKEILLTAAAVEELKARDDVEVEPVGAEVRVAPGSFRLIGG